MPRKITIEELEKRIFDIHGNVITIVNRDDYKHTHHKILCHDITYGDWMVAPYVLLRGSGHPLRAPEKTKQYFRQKYGVDNPFQSKECKEKIQQTLLKHYGVAYAGQLPQNRIKCESKEAQLKKIETMKLNHTFKQSKAENECYEYLCKLYGNTNVQRQFMINNWRIDFYLSNINVYIQFDGVYWHGLNKPIEYYKNSSSKKNLKIYETWCRDQAQNVWFKQNNLHLIRITDIEWYKTHQINFDALKIYDYYNVLVEEII